MNRIIRVESYRHPPGPVQCHNCQLWHHTQATCKLAPKCVKCAGSHRSKDCTIVKGVDNVKCANCQGGHTANWGGCPKRPSNFKTTNTNLNPNTRTPPPPDKTYENFPDLPNKQHAEHQNQTQYEKPKNNDLAEIWQLLKESNFFNKLKSIKNYLHKFLKAKDNKERFAIALEAFENIFIKSNNKD